MIGTVYTPFKSNLIILYQINKQFVQQVLKKFFINKKGFLIV